MKKLASNIFYNALYQVLILLIPFITIPYVSRVLGVYNLGVNSYVLSIATFLAAIIPSGLPQMGNREIARTDPEDRAKRFSQLWLIQLCAGVIIITLYIIVVTCFMKYKLLFYIEVPFLLGYMFDISWYYVGIGETKKVVIKNSAIKILSLILIFMFVKTKHDLPIYMLINSCSLFISNLVFWFTLRDEFKGQKVDLSLDNYPTQYLKESFIITMQTFITQFYTNFDNVMVTHYAGVKSNSYYDQSQRVARMVVTIVQSVNYIIMPNLARADEDGDQDAVNKIFKTSLDYIFTFGLFFALILMVNARRFVPFFWGESWKPMIPNMFWVSLIVIFISLSGVFINQYALSKRIIAGYTWPYMVGAVTNVSLNYFTFKPGQSIIGTRNLDITEFMVMATAMFVLRKHLDYKKLLTGHWKFIATFLICLFVGLRFPVNFSNDFLTLATQSIVTTILFVILLFAFRTRYIEDLKFLINRIKKDKK